VLCTNFSYYKKFLRKLVRLDWASCIIFHW
jgi:hypothetical protein